MLGEDLRILLVSYSIRSIISRSISLRETPTDDELNERIQEVIIKRGTFPRIEKLVEIYSETRGSSTPGERGHLFLCATEVFSKSSEVVLNAAIRVAAAFLFARSLENYDGDRCPDEALDKLGIKFNEDDSDGEGQSGDAGSILVLRPRTARRSHELTR